MWLRSLAPIRRVGGWGWGSGGGYSGRYPKSMLYRPVSMISPTIVDYNQHLCMFNRFK